MTTSTIEAERLAALGVELGPELWPTRYTGSLDEFGLPFPTLVLAAPLELCHDLTSLSPDRRWLALFHQHAGLACRHLHVLATPLTLTAHAADAFATWHERVYETNLGSVNLPLDKAVAYRDWLRSTLNLDCQVTWPSLSEAVYPFDPDPEHLERVTDEPLPDSLNDWLEFDSPLSSVIGLFGRWRALVLAENSD